jgi:hypothetical protein
MREFTAEDLTIAVVAIIGLVILIAVFVYVVKQIIVRKD